MERQVDIVIAGGGLNGPALALALGRAGFSVALADARPRAAMAADDFDGRAYALSAASCRMLAALGLWQGLVPNAQPILDIKVSDGRAGEGASPLFLHFDHAEIDEGPMGHMLEDRYLRRGLADALDATPGVTLLDGIGVVSEAAAPGGTEVRLSDGRVLATGLLVGCDGRSSGVAARAGIRRVGWDYGQTSLVAAIAHELPHHGTAQQFFTPEGPLAILPLPGNLSSIVWTETRARAAEVLALGDAAFLDVLRPRFGTHLGAISLAGKRFSYPLGLSLATRLVGDRIALAGDSAHGIHPLAGQGLNLGLRDVAALAEVLVAARRRGEDVGSADVLERYQRWRRFDAAVLGATTDTINRVFSNDNPLLRLGRDLALGALNRMPGARRALIREAAGLTGDLPALMRGHAL